MRQFIRDIRVAPGQHVIAIAFILIAAWFSTVVFSSGCTNNETPIFIKQAQK